MTKPFLKRTIFAPAKINLALHVLERKKDGYHKLDSLVTFADIGDIITISPSPFFKFNIDGDFAHLFSELEKSEKPDSGNLVVKAVYFLAGIANIKPDIEITLTKNLPIASGIGGGSADAAAVICGLCELWNIPKNSTFLPAFLKTLGADVPVCMECTPCFIRDIGDQLTPAPFLPETPIVLINPLKPCPTRDVFLSNAHFHPPLTQCPNDIHSITELCAYLKDNTNSLEYAATQIIPEIKNIITTLSLQNGNLLSRMSGSGATCFGLFNTPELAEHAATTLAQENPDWWVKSGWINNTVRY